MVVLFVSFLALSLWKDGLEWIASLIGISYAPAALFLILIMSIFGMLVEFSLIISKQSEWIKQSAQEIGLLKLELEKLHQKLEEAENSDTTELQNEFIKQQENESET